MINAVKSIINNKDEDLRNFLITIHLFKVFEPLLEIEWVDNITFKQLVRYIVKLYSLDSNEVVQNTDWRKNKKRVYDSEELPEKMWNEVGMLSNETVRKVIQKWLEIQDEETLTQLKLLKDLRVEMQSASVSPLKKTGDPMSPIDYQTKFDCAKYAKDLLLMIKDCESNLIQNSPLLKELVQDAKKSHKNGVTIGPETFAK